MSGGALGLTSPFLVYLTPAVGKCFGGSIVLVLDLQPEIVTIDFITVFISAQESREEETYQNPNKTSYSFSFLFFFLFILFFSYLAGVIHFWYSSRHYG